MCIYISALYYTFLAAFFFIFSLLEKVYIWWAKIFLSWCIDSEDDKSNSQWILEKHNVHLISQLKSRNSTAGESVHWGLFLQLDK